MKNWKERGHAEDHYTGGSKLVDEAVAQVEKYRKIVKLPTNHNFVSHEVGHDVEYEVGHGISHRVGHGVTGQPYHVLSNTCLRRRLLCLNSKVAATQSAPQGVGIELPGQLISFLIFLTMNSISNTKRSKGECEREKDLSGWDSNSVGRSCAFVKVDTTAVKRFLGSPESGNQKKLSHLNMETSRVSIRTGL